jgi:phospholipase D3/4
MPIYLRSLAALNDSHIIGGSIQVKLFVVPAFSPSQAQIPFARVNHNKYMVTENTAYIGTSNWSADYFVDTGGVGFAIIPKSNETNLRNDLQSIFERDWHSSYAKTL